LLREFLVAVAAGTAIALGFSCSRGHGWLGFGALGVAYSAAYACALYVLSPAFREEARRVLGRVVRR
jgi:hypothetical protein